MDIQKNPSFSTILEEQIQQQIQRQKQQGKTSKTQYSSGFTANPLWSKVHHFKAKISYPQTRNQEKTPPLVKTESPLSTAWLNSLESCQEIQAKDYFKSHGEFLCDIAKKEDFKAIFRKIAKKVHPDLNPTLGNLEFLYLKKHIECLENSFLSFLEQQKVA